MIKIILLILSLSSLNSEDFRKSDRLLNQIKPETLNSELRLKYDYISMCVSVYNNNPLLAKRHASLVLDSFSEIPDRYFAIATIVSNDTEHWSEHGLDSIKRNMNSVKKDLRSGYGDKIVEDKQKRVIEDIDKLIKEKEDWKNGKKKIDENGEAVIIRVSSQGNPQDESEIQHNVGQGKVDQKKLKELVDKWGSMPEKERARAIMDLTKDYPARYRTLIEEYFKSLSKDK